MTFTNYNKLNLCRLWRVNKTKIGLSNSKYRNQTKCRENTIEIYDDSCETVGGERPHRPNSYEL